MPYGMTYPRESTAGGATQVSMRLAKNFYELSRGRRTRRSGRCEGVDCDLGPAPSKRLGRTDSESARTCDTLNVSFNSGIGLVTNRSVKRRLST